jgi:hypothetical protein
MYKIIGVDQREYGPISADQIRQWIREGRANASTLCQPDGTTGWRPLASFPEFGFAAPPPVAPPVYSSSSTNGNAIAGLIFGILAMTCPCGGVLVGALGIIFSCLALSQLNHTHVQKGRGMALAGLVLSIIGLLFWLGFGALGIFTRHGAHYLRHWNY